MAEWDMKKIKSIWRWVYYSLLEVCTRTNLAVRACGTPYLQAESTQNQQSRLLLANAQLKGPLHKSIKSSLPRQFCTRTY